MILAHKITLDPKKEQEAYFRRACGTARFAYNWALAEWKRQYKAGKKVTVKKLRSLWNTIRREQFPWTYDVTKCASCQAIIDLNQGFQRFFKKIGRYPRFKKRGIRDSFGLWNDQFKIDGYFVRIPNLGWVRMREQLRFQGKILNATISRTADKWFISINVETKIMPIASENQGVIGVDLGVKHLATLSNGKMVIGRKPHTVLIERLKRLNRSLSRKVRGSKNWYKAKVKLTRLYARMVNIRNDTLHKLTTKLTKKYAIVGIEDLNVKGMIQNRRFARVVSDMGFGEFRRQLTYKSQLYDCEVVVHNRWFASSKTCSNCEHVLEKLSLSTRQWTCPQCGIIHDRDFNAAKNLKPVAVGYTVEACGAEGSGFRRMPKVKPSAMKQEPFIHAFEYVKESR